jgi:hypothetical protein
MAEEREDKSERSQRLYFGGAGPKNRPALKVAMEYSLFLTTQVRLREGKALGTEDSRE